ncbi:MAG: phosphatase PAP2 family protein [Dehalococcoidales bacterium]|nr:phosphatase PAP2 family protein [Dehalococcoidales bacterium]
MMSADERLFLWINGFAGKLPLLDEFLKGIANDYFFIVSSCLVLLALWFGTREIHQREKNQKAIIGASLSLGIATGIVGIFNFFYFHPRPFIELPTNLLFYQPIDSPLLPNFPTDSSFPSHSTAIVFAIAIAILLADKKAGIILLFLASILGFSRIYVGIHYPSDILAGAAIGAATAFLIFRLIRILEPWPSRLLRLIRRSYLA